MSNKAAWLTEKLSYPFKVDDAPMPTPGSHAVTIRVRAVAINPADPVVQTTGIIFEKYPRIMGWDAAGEVVAVGSEVTSFKIGDRVLGCPECESLEDIIGSFQLYCNLTDALTAKLPDSIDFKDGCVLPVAMCTACVSLFEDYNLGLPYPEPTPKPAGKVILVWGGASSVGSCGIQAAKAAGLEVAAIASAANAEYCKSIGADYVFDYKKPETLVEDVVSTFRGKTFAGVFAAVMGDDVYTKSAEIASQLGGKQMVATVVPPQMKLNIPLPAGVEIGYNFCSTLQNTAVGPAIWERWLPGALANGTLKCKPNAYVVGHGLDKIQEACDLMKQGASARKYVVELP